MEPTEQLPPPPSLDDRPAASQPVPGAGSRIGRYEVTGLLGEGGMGQVEFPAPRF